MEQIQNMLNFNKSIDSSTQIALVVAVALIVNHHMYIVKMPEMVMYVLRENSMLLAGATIVASYIDLKYGVVIASLLYISMNDPSNETPEIDDKDNNGPDTTESKEVSEVSEVSEVRGNLAMPELEISENPLPTQDNSPPTEQDKVPHPENGSPDVDEKPYRMGVLDEESNDKENVNVIGWENNNSLATL